MKCKCEEIMRKTLEENYKDKFGVNIEFPIKKGLDFKNSKSYFSIPIKIRYKNKKKNGDLEKRFNYDEISMQVNFCPMCGQEVDK